MKNFESQQFRDELAKTIKQAPKEERRSILDKAREEAEVSKKLETDPHYENYAEPTALDQLIPGIDLSKLSSKERLEDLLKKVERSEFGVTEIGNAWVDTNFLDSFMHGIGGYEQFYPEQFITRINPPIRVKEEETRIPINLEEALEPFKERLRDQIIIEIGPGLMPTGYYLANLVEARAYVAVDPFCASVVEDRMEMRASAKKSVTKDERFMKRFGNLAKGLSRWAAPYLGWGISSHIIRDTGLEKNKVPWNSAQEDALVFLKSLPDNSVSVLMSGIREGVIPSGHLKDILDEISRVLDPRGTFLAVQSDIHDPAQFDEDITFQQLDHGLKIKLGTMYMKKRKQSVKSSMPVLEN